MCPKSPRRQAKCHPESMQTCSHKSNPSARNTPALPRHRHPSNIPPILHLVHQQYARQKKRGGHRHQILQMQRYLSSNYRPTWDLHINQCHHKSPLNKTGIGISSAEQSSLPIQRHGIRFLRLPTQSRQHTHTHWRRLQYGANRPTIL